MTVCQQTVRVHCKRTLTKPMMGLISVGMEAEPTLASVSTFSPWYTTSTEGGWMPYASSFSPRRSMNVDPSRCPSLNAWMGSR